MTWRSASLLVCLLGLGCEGPTVSLGPRKPDAGFIRDASTSQDASEDRDSEDEDDEDEDECEPLFGGDCTDQH